jgi:hypothetical protein
MKELTAKSSSNVEVIGETYVACEDNMQNYNLERCSSTAEDDANDDDNDVQDVADDVLDNMVNNSEEEAVLTVKPRAEFEDSDANLTCGQCTQTFSTVEECQVHDCDVSSVDDIDLGRRTLSKRRGKPLKIKSKRKRGRPRMKRVYVEVDSDVDFTEKPIDDIPPDVQEPTAPVKKKRGRPRKYGTDGGLLPPKPKPLPKPRRIRKEKPVKLKREPKPGQLHICDMCGKAFGKLQKLQIHIYSHTGERPYK